jgi:hypothetical protein
MKHIMIIIFTIILESSFLIGVNNASVENMKIEIFEKEKEGDDESFDNTLDFVILSPASIIFENIYVKHNHRESHYPDEVLITPFRPPCLFFTS